MKRRPLIGVTGPSRRGRWAWTFSKLAVQRARGRARRLRPGDSAEELDDLDGLVVGGGSHVEPSRYAQEPQITAAYDPERDEFEWGVLRWAIERRLPVLGICRGHQLLNVYFGGTLHQDLMSVFEGLILRTTFFARKRVDLRAGSRLRRIMGCDAVEVNSLHKQGVDRAGRGLSVAAQDAHGVVQAIERGDPREPFVVGVQWHPEYLPQHREHQRIFRALVEAAASGQATQPPPSSTCANVE